MAARRFLIVNADDFGLSRGVNDAVITTHAQGIVTSASLMVRQAAAPDAAARCREYPDLSVGLHLDLGEWSYQNGTWIPVYEVVALDDSAVVADEVQRQLEAFRRLLGRNPTHLDSHQHVHRREPVRSVAASLARELDVPLRHFTPGIRYCGEFYGQSGDGVAIPGAISVDALLRIFASLPAGTTELACHPGEALELDTMYREEREEEARCLRDPRLREVLAAERIQLRPFSDVLAAWGSTTPTFADRSVDPGPDPAKARGCV
jgi:predicted glycoside hydrolase/deacetylase ChbG (UPF0249 family)